MESIQKIEYAAALVPQDQSPIPFHGWQRLVDDPLRELQSLPDDAHWFCPRSGNEKGFYFPDDVQLKAEDPTSTIAKKRLAQVEEAERRKQLFLDSLLIFAYDADHATIYQEWIESQLERQMTRCDVCIRECHRSRRELQSKLQQ